MSVVVRICTKWRRLCAVYWLLSILMPGPVIDCARGLAGWFRFEHPVYWLHEEYKSWAPKVPSNATTPAWTWQPACFVGTIINLSVAAMRSLKLTHNLHRTYSLGKHANNIIAQYSFIQQMVLLHIPGSYSEHASKLSFLGLNSKMPMIIWLACNSFVIGDIASFVDGTANYSWTYNIPACCWL